MRILITVILSFFYTQCLFAKTSGNYYSYDVRGSQEEKDRANIDNSAVNSSIDASYKHVIPVSSGLFVAPGFNYKRSSTLTKNNQALTSQQQQQMSVTNKYDVKLDLGYEVSAGLAPYLTGGMSYGANAIYSSDAKLSDPLNEMLAGTRSGYFYGVGTMTSVTRNFNLGLEYNAQNQNVRNGNNTNPERIDVYKLKASFKF